MWRTAKAEVGLRVGIECESIKHIIPSPPLFAEKCAHSPDPSWSSVSESWLQGLWTSAVGVTAVCGLWLDLHLVMEDGQCHPDLMYRTELSCDAVLTERAWIWIDKRLTPAIKLRIADG